MPTLETPTQNLETLNEEIGTLLDELAAKAKVITEDSFEEFKQAQALLQQAKTLGLEVKDYQQKFTEAVARYYDEIINKVIGQLEEKVNNSQPEAYLLLTKAGHLLSEAKGFGVDMLEEHEKMQQLDKLTQEKIRL